jgi:hypothetical protein
MQPILIYPGELCYDARGFHCKRDEDEDGHDLHCPKCHQYATDRMTRETMTVYRYPKPDPPYRGPSTIHTPVRHEPGRDERVTYGGPGTSPV